MSSAYTYIDDTHDLQQSLKTLSSTTPNAQQGFSAYDDRLDLNQYVGWNTISDWNPLTQKLFTKTTVNMIAQKVADYLTGVDANGRRIIPSERVVISALFGIFKEHVPRTGDIYGKFLVVDDSKRNDYAYIVDKTISLLVQGIRDDLGMAEQNQKLTIWTTVLGDFNEHGLRQHPPLKINNGKRPDPMLFHMRY
jgi:hypothetical protein|uniref:Uncharacterized protein n=1 Tax=viral metagenome TaxID=1070528 RepID=A0A6C0KGU9_9ZZZZ